MRPNLLPQLAFLLALPFFLAACAPEGEPFTSPADGSVTGADVPVRLPLPGDTPVRLSLDGVVLDAAGFPFAAGGLAGALADLEPGVHELRARYFGAFYVPVTVVSRFEVAVGAGFTARGSVEQVSVVRAEPGQALELHGAAGWQAEGVADEQGSLIFREVPPGDGYRVVGRDAGTGLIERSDPFEVLSLEESLPPREFYTSQQLGPGYGYITTRDGTKLAVYVQLPGPPEEGPYPTVVNYSGYSPAEPGGPLPIDIDGINLEPLCSDIPVLCDAPNHPSGIIAGVMGFATVGVNMRGTGCSGGAYDFFEPLQLTDGYDVIEIVAAQPWVKHNQVGMVGISYPGISQLFVAAARPPGLAAITPLSVISGADTTLAPGGIINNGFALEWAKQVLDRADPYGQGWEQDRVDAGDTTCAENQLLHSQKVDIIAKARSVPFYVPEVYDPLNPRSFVDEIDVPVFTAGAWQDEQTGGHFPDLWDRFTSAPVVRMTGYNGAHADGYAPEILAEWKNFLDLYVNRGIRPLPPLLRLIAPVLFGEIFGAGTGIPDDRFDPAAPYEETRAAYEAEPPVRILFESGGGANGARKGAPEPSFELLQPAWPPPATVPTRLYLHPDGSLRDFVPSEAESASAFRHDDDKGAETYDVDDPFEKALPDITWLPEEPGRQAVFATEPLAEDLTLVGFASADLWVQSDAEDADLEVTISEIRPDGQEMYVTNGWLRASLRTLAPGSTPLRPIPTRLEADATPLPAGAWELVRVEIYPFAHVFRAGSRLRLAVSTPGGNKGRWKFEVLQLGDGIRHRISHSAALPSSLVLPVIPGLEAPTELPECPSLRSQPCREHVPHANLPAD